MTLLLVLQFEDLPPLTTSTLGALIPKVCTAAHLPLFSLTPSQGLTLSTWVRCSAAPPQLGVP